jgi:hypothetical protein
MSVAEAIERRARMIRVHGSLEEAHEHAHDRPADARPDERHCREWNAWLCLLCWQIRQTESDASQPEDVALFDGAPVAMCATCRVARV